MRRITFLTALVSCSALFGQNYRPLLGNLNEWHFTTCYFGCITDVYYTDGDTLVNGKTYKILDGYHYIHRNLLLREDVEEQKIYLTITAPQYTEDILLYDFSLSEGDSIKMLNPITPFPPDGGFFILDSVRMRLLADENEYRHFYFSPALSNTNSTENAEWIEGVGSLSLINAPGGYPDINGVGHLSCSFKNTEVFYSNLDSITACEPLFLSINAVVSSLNSMQLYALPESNCFLLTDTQQVTEVSVFELTGKRVKTVVLPKNENTIHLDLNGLRSGIYIIVAAQHRFKTLTFKVVVK